MPVTNTLDPTAVPTLLGRHDWKKNLNFLRYLVAQPLKSLSDVTLVGIDDQISQNNFGTTKVLSVSDTRRTGEVIGIEFYTIASLALSGTIIRESFQVELFKADPSINVNATGIGNTTLVHRVNRVSVDGTDWEARTPTEGFGNKDTAVPFETSDGGTLWAAIRSTGTTQWNAVGTANEKLVAKFFLRMDY